MTGHAKFSPSSAQRVVTCPASFKANEDQPRTSNWFAVEGTIAHYIHARILLGASPDEFLGKEPYAFMPLEEMHFADWDCIPNNWTIDQEHLDYVMNSVDWVRSMMQEGDQLLVEQRVNISEYTPIPDQFGTSDVVILHKSGHLTCFDLKFGKGVQVYAEDNHQLALYGLGTISKFDWCDAFIGVTIAVSQPRIDHFDTWDTTVDNLKTFGNYMKERFTLALEDDAPYQPDEHACKFCSFKPQCPALYRELLNMFDKIEASPSVSTLPEPNTADVLNKASLIRGYLDAVEAHATHLLLEGKAVEGYKLVEGRSFRRWRPDYETEIVTYLVDVGVDPYTDPELISAAVASTKTPKQHREGLSAFIDKPAGKPTLASDADKRPAMQFGADTMFDPIP